MNPYKKYAKNVGLASIVNIISTLTGLILLPILTKSLGAELYGIYALILVTILLTCTTLHYRTGLCNRQVFGCRKRLEKREGITTYNL